MAGEKRNTIKRTIKITSVLAALITASAPLVAQSSSVTYRKDSSPPVQLLTTAGPAIRPGAVFVVPGANLGRYPEHLWIQVRDASTGAIASVRARRIERMGNTELLTLQLMSPLALSTSGVLQLFRGLGATVPADSSSDAGLQAEFSSFSGIKAPGTFDDNGPIITSLPSPDLCHVCNTTSSPCLFDIIGSASLTVPSTHCSSDEETYPAGSRLNAAVQMRVSGCSSAALDNRWFNFSALEINTGNLTAFQIAQEIADGFNDALEAHLDVLADNGIDIPQGNIAISAQPESDVRLQFACDNLEVLNGYIQFYN